MSKALFSNGTEFEIWEANNCSNCVWSVCNTNQDPDTLVPACRIQRVILDGMGWIETTDGDYDLVHGGYGGHCIRFAHTVMSKWVVSDVDKAAVRNFWVGEFTLTDKEAATGQMSLW